MSICRFGKDSDVNIVETFSRTWSILLADHPDRDDSFDTIDIHCSRPKEMLELLRLLGAHGYKIPAKAYTEVRKAKDGGLWWQIKDIAYTAYANFRYGR